MKSLIIVCFAGLFIFGYLKRQDIKDYFAGSNSQLVVPTPTPTPVFAPHTAKEATATAMRLYPDLGKKGSSFNRAFLELYEERKQTDPSSLTRPEWPMDLAQRAASMLNVKPYSIPIPTPIRQVTIVAPERTPSALDRGAYNEKKNVAKPPIIRYVPR